MPHFHSQMKSRGLIFKCIHIFGSPYSSCKQYYSCVHVGQVRSPRPERGNLEVEKSGVVLCRTRKRNLPNPRLLKGVSRAFCLGKAFLSEWLSSFKCKKGMRNDYLFLFSSTSSFSRGREGQTQEKEAGRRLSRSTGELGVSYLGQAHSHFWTIAQIQKSI